MTTTTSDAPLISVIIPSFNGTEPLTNAIRSVQAQTVGDFEIIVIDDCSVIDIAPALAPVIADPRIRLIRQEVNRGVSAARNTGIAAARGRFVAFLDNDDSWFPTKLERQLAVVLASNNPDAVFCVTQTIVDLAEGTHLIRPLKGKQPDERLDEFIFVRGGFCQTSSFFVSRSLAHQVGFRDIKTGEDHLFAIDLCNAGADYVLIEEALTVYHNDIRPGRLSNGTTLEQGRAFMAAVGDTLSAKALAGYEIRYLGPLLLKQNPLAGFRQIVGAVAGGAMPAKYAASLLVRTILPAHTYHRVRAAILGTRGAPQGS